MLYAQSLSEQTYAKVIQANYSPYCHPIVYYSQDGRQSCGWMFPLPPYRPDLSAKLQGHRSIFFPDFHVPSTYGRSKLTGSLKAFRVQSVAFCQGCLRGTPDIPSFIYNHLFFVLSIYPSNVGTRNAIFRLMHRSKHTPCLFSAGFSAMIF